jgi:hypothetical protein
MKPAIAMALRFFLAVCAAAPGRARAQGAAEASAPPVAVRAGEHHGYGRMVFPLPPGQAPPVLDGADSGDGPVVVHFAPGTPVVPPPVLPRNVSVFSASAGEVALHLKPGVRVRQMVAGSQLWLDFLDPEAAPGARADAEAAKKRKGSGHHGKPPVAPAPPESAAAPSPPAPASATPQPAPAAPAPPAAAPPPVETPPAPPAAVMPPAAPAPGAIAVTRIAAVDGAGAGFLVATPQDTGAAAFVRGDQAFLVFDIAQPFDLSALAGDADFAAASVRQGKDWTVIQMPIAIGRNLVARHLASGWQFLVATLNGEPARIAADQTAEGLLLAASAPGRAVTVSDPATGGTLLVGTLRREGEAIAAPRHFARYALLPTWLGVAAARLGDQVSLQTVKEGFLLSAGDGSDQAAAGQAPLRAQPEALTQRFDLPSGDTGAAPAGRIGAARRMIALGLGLEAQGELRQAGLENPSALNDPDYLGLSAIAAILAARPGMASGIDDPRLTGSDEVAFWRNVRALAANATPSYATLAATAPIALRYPPPLRDRVLPDVLAALASNGEAETATLLLQALGNAGPRFDLARAIAEEQRGDHDKALALYAALMQSPDPQLAGQALLREVMLQHRLGTLSAAAAADALTARLYLWRGNGFELTLRTRIAYLRAEAAQWRQAFAALRETARLFPAEPAVKAEMRALFDQMMAAGGPAKVLSPFDFAAFAEDNADLFHDTLSSNAVTTALADELLALDLPGRAAPLLQKLEAQAADPVARATFGGRLASVRLREGDAAGALAALSDSAPAEGADPPLSASLAESRLLTEARAIAAQGDAARAVDLLGASQSRDLLTARAGIAEQARDWQSAADSLSSLLTQTVPASGALDPVPAKLVLRLAADEAQAGDRAALAKLRAAMLPRLGEGANADMLRVLAADPIAGGADLPRARAETEAVRALADAGLGARAKPARR